MAACCFSNSLLCCTATDKVTLLIGARTVLQPKEAHGQAAKPAVKAACYSCEGFYGEGQQGWDGEGLIDSVRQVYDRQL